MDKIVIRAMRAVDWEAVSAIYTEGIATRLATFETEAPAWEKWDRAHLDVCRLVACRGDAVIGWAALLPVSSRCVYRGVADLSVYIAASARGQGVGKQLLTALIGASEAAGFWTIQSGIMADNRSSIALHEACGFRRVGTRERIGQLDGVWRDTILMERRSRVVGFE